MMMMIPRLTPCNIIYLERERRGEHPVRQSVYLKKSLQQVIQKPYKNRATHQLIHTLNVSHNITRKKCNHVQHGM